MGKLDKPGSDKVDKDKRATLKAIRDGAILAVGANAALIGGSLLVDKINRKAPDGTTINTAGQLKEAEGVAKKAEDQKKTDERNEVLENRSVSETWNRDRNINKETDGN